jgi:hypothetical protein
MDGLLGVGRKDFMLALDVPTQFAKSGSLEFSTRTPKLYHG